MKKASLIMLAAVLAVTMTSCKAAETSGAETTAGSVEKLSETTAEHTEAAVTTASETTTAETTSAAASETTTAETAITTASETTTAETAAECHCPTEWQHAYSEYLNGLDFLAGGVYLGDINGDDIPEAVIEINPFEMTEILYFNDDGMQKLELWTESVWGSVRYLPDTKQILFEPVYGHTDGTYGYADYNIYSWNGSDYEITSAVQREAGFRYTDESGTEHIELGQAYIDGSEVDNDTFENKLAEIKQLKENYSYFPVAYICDYDYNKNPDMDSVRDYIKTNFPCFDNWELIDK